MTFIVQHRS